jgi:two pore calcium channel protein 1
MLCILKYFIYFQGVTLLIMVVEACVVLLRQSSHFRVTRALRPIFVLDNRRCGGVRRFIRQVNHCFDF